MWRICARSAEDIETTKLTKRAKILVSLVSSVVESFLCAPRAKAFGHMRSPALERGADFATGERVSKEKPELFPVHSGREKL
jgi:hypothetical protein